MCDQSTVQYNDGDVVWVKLGSCWWPGEVHDIKRVPPEIQASLKRSPIAFVHFFQENTYEYVKNLDFIYHYNCRRKKEFIQKGLDMFRAKQKHMDKFPEDICTAERLTNGDPDIITSDEFLPQQKVNYNLIFSTPSPKKSPNKRLSTGKVGRGRKSFGAKLNNYTPTEPLNIDLNYEVHNLSSNKNIMDDNLMGSNFYNCDKCNFKCTRINVMIYHSKAHANNEINIKGKRKYNKNKLASPKKLSKILTPCTTNTIDEDLELLRQGIDICTYTIESPVKQKYKPKIKFAKSLKLNDKKKNSKKDVSTLLADWDDSDEDTSAKDSGSQSRANDTKSDEVKSGKETSCFDFQEDEDISPIISKSPGRKIPRVIPENQKVKSDSIIDEQDNSESELKSKSKLKQKGKDIPEEPDQQDETLRNEFDTLMAETSIPTLPSLIESEKSKFKPLDVSSPIEKRSRGRKKSEPVQHVSNKELNVLQNMDTSVDESLTKEKKTRGRKKKLLMSVEPDTETIPETDNASIDEDIKQVSVEEAKSEKKKRGRKSRIQPIEQHENEDKEDELKENEAINETEIVTEKVDKPRRGRKPKIKTVEEDKTLENNQLEESSINETSLNDTLKQNEAVEKKSRGRRKQEISAENILSDVSEIDEVIPNTESRKPEQKSRGRRKQESLTENILSDFSETEDHSIKDETIAEVLKVEKKRGRKKIEQSVKTEIVENDDLTMLNETLSNEDKLETSQGEKKSRGRKKNETIKVKDSSETVENLQHEDSENNEIKTLQENVSMIDSPKSERKSRGRKKTEHIKVDEDSEAKINSTVEPLKIEPKPRGRPKKEQLVKDSADESFSDSTNETLSSIADEKKSRGRKKVEVLEESNEKVLEKNESMFEDNSEPEKKMSRTRNKGKSPQKDISPKGQISKEIKGNFDNKNKKIDDSNLSEILDSDKKILDNKKILDSHPNVSVEKILLDFSEPDEQSETESFSKKSRGRKKELINESIESILQDFNESEEKTDDTLDVNKLDKKNNRKKSETREDIQLASEKKKSKDENDQSTDQNKKSDEKLIEDKKSLKDKLIKKDSDENIKSYEELKSKPEKSLEGKILKEEKAQTKSPGRIYESKVFDSFLYGEENLVFESKSKSRSSDSKRKTLEKVDSTQISDSSGLKSPKGRKPKIQAGEKITKIVMQGETEYVRHSPQPSESSHKSHGRKKSVDFKSAESSSTDHDSEVEKSSSDVETHRSFRSNILKEKRKSDILGTVEEKKVVSSEEDKKEFLDVSTSQKGENIDDSLDLMSKKFKRTKFEVKLNENKEENFENENKTENSSVIKSPVRRKSKSENEKNVSLITTEQISLKTVAPSALLDIPLPVETKFEQDDSSFKNVEPIKSPTLGDELPKRKRGRPSNASKQFYFKSKSESEDESKPEKLSKKIDDSSNDTPEKPVGTEMIEQEKNKQDDSVKVMISLNDFKMEDIPLPPTPSKSIESVEENKVLESDISSNDSKRTPIKFEISNMKAQLNKKLLHKSFLSGDEDEDSLSLVRKGQLYETKGVSNLKRSLGRDLNKECESPKKRVMADYKKELDLEKSKELEKLEKSDDVIEKSDIDEKIIQSPTKLKEMSEIDDEKIVAGPLRHEDISAVINSGSEVKIIDKNLTGDCSKLPVAITQSESIIKTNLNSEIEIDSKTEKMNEEEKTELKQVVKNTAEKTKESKLINYVDELESIENEIQKITSAESSPCKANAFPENIALPTTPSKETLIGLPKESPSYSSQRSSLTSPTTAIKISESSHIITTNISAAPESSIESEIAKLTDTKPGDSDIIPEQTYSTTSSKLLEILESKGEKTKIEKKFIPVTLSNKAQTFVGLTAAQKKTVALSSKIIPSKTTKFILKSPVGKEIVTTTPPTAIKKSKPIILSEEIIKPANDANITQKIPTKRNFEEDIEDKGGIKKFIIEKAVADSSTSSPNTPKSSIRLKPTVISTHTIITSRGKIVDNIVDSNKETIDDNNMFDINSMPIVLSDDILTPESIENMPIVISSMPETDKQMKTVQIINKSGKIIPEKVKIVPQQKIIKPVLPGVGKNQKIYQTSSSKLLANKTAVITQPGKPEKFIILPSSTPPTGQKYTVGKRTIRASPQTSVVVNKSSISATPTSVKTPLSTGNKVMLVTNSQGQQSRIILSPAQQKMLGTKMGTKIVARSAAAAAASAIQNTKGTTLALNNIVTSKGTILTPTSTYVQTKSTTVSPQTVLTSKGQLLTQVHNQSIITSKGQILTQVTPTQMKTIKGAPIVTGSGKKIQLQSQKIILPAGSTSSKTNLHTLTSGIKTKTVLVKGTQRQVIQKIQPSTSQAATSQLRTVVQKSPLLKSTTNVTTPTTISTMISGKQKVTIAPKTPNVIKRQVIRSPATSQAPQQRIILQKMTTDTKSPIQQRTVQQKIVETKSYIKPNRAPSMVSSTQSVPSLAPLSSNVPKTNEMISKPTTSSLSETTTSVLDNTQTNTPQKQLIIHDDFGNPTSITQGQILAVPGGEVVDGQPQSYVLVTVDESGNLLPLDNQALMALDPSLIGPDGNVMLHFNQGIAGTADNVTKDSVAPAETSESTKISSETVINTPPQDYQQLLITDDQQNILALAGGNQQLLMTDNQNLILTDQAVLPAGSKSSTISTSDQVTYSISNAEDGQQIFISGDPEKAQHLINALATGSQDLSQIISNAEGNLIINADGQQIILNTDGSGNADQIILASSAEGFSIPENYNTDFVTQVTTNQDILAAALANTVFPQESSITESLNIVTSATGGPLMSTTSELSPSLYQNMQLPNLTSGAVLETASLTNLAPIMSPLEVPTSGTSKKIPLEIETSSQVPKSLELPITITDPNISQTVNSQLANELQTNLGLPITITDPNISNVRSSDLTTTSFGYSLPSIDDSVDSVTTSANSGPISMPLLTEELESDSTLQQNKLDKAESDNTGKIIEETVVQTEQLTDIFEPSKTAEIDNSNQSEEVDNSNNALDVLASVTTASGMINVVDNNPELEQIFAEKKDDQLPANVFAQNNYLNDNDLENKSTNDSGNHIDNVHESFARTRLVDDHFLESPHSEIDANSDEISIQPSIVTEESVNESPLSSADDQLTNKQNFDEMDDDKSAKKSNFNIS